LRGDWQGAALLQEQSQQLLAAEPYHSFHRVYAEYNSLLFWMKENRSDKISRWWKRSESQMLSLLNPIEQCQFRLQAIAAYALGYYDEARSILEKGILSPGADKLILEQQANYLWLALVNAESSDLVTAETALLRSLEIAEMNATYGCYIEAWFCLDGLLTKLHCRDIGPQLEGRLNKLKTIHHYMELR